MEIVLLLVAVIAIITATIGSGLLYVWMENNPDSSSSRAMNGCLIAGLIVDLLSGAVSLLIWILCR